MPLTFPSSVYLPIPLISRPSHLPPMFNVTPFFLHRSLFNLPIAHLLFSLPSAYTFPSPLKVLYRVFIDGPHIIVFKLASLAPLLLNFLTSTLTPPTQLSTIISSFPWRQHSTPCGLMPPIMSTNPSPLPQSLRPLLPHPPSQPVFWESLLPASPTQGQSIVVATNHSMSGSLSWWSTVSEQHS